MLKIARCLKLNTLEVHLSIGTWSSSTTMLSAWDVILGLLQDGLHPSLKHVKVVCIPDSHNMGLFRFEELERLVTVPKISLQSLTFEDALIPCEEQAMLQEWERRCSWISSKSSAPRILGFHAFRDTLMARMPGLAASGVLRVTSQMRHV